MTFLRSLPFILLYWWLATLFCSLQKWHYDKCHNPIQKIKYFKPMPKLVWLKPTRSPKKGQSQEPDQERARHFEGIWKPNPSSFFLFSFFFHKFNFPHHKNTTGLLRSKADQSVLKQLTFNPFRLRKFIYIYM